MGDAAMNGASGNGNKENGEAAVVAMDCNSSIPEAEVRFRGCCQNMLLDEILMQQAMNLYQAVWPLMAEVSQLSGGTEEETERLWTAGILYIVKKTDKRSHSGLTLSKILCASGVSIIDFYKDFSQFLSKCEFPLKAICGDDLERRIQIKEEQAIFIHLVLVFNYFRRIYQDYFLPAENESENSEAVSLPKRFAWLLFLAVRVHFGSFPDLVTSTTSLLAVLAILIVHMPISSRAFSLEDASLFPRRDHQGINIVASLSQVGDACEEDVMQMVLKTQSVIAKVFTSLSGTTDCSHVKNLSGFSTEGVIYFDGLMDDHMLAENVSILERCYEESYSERGDLDERLCMSKAEGYESFVGAGNYSLQRDRERASQLASDSSPIRSSRMPPTPVTITMTTAKWLRTVITPLPAEPSPELQEFLKSCDRDVTDEVTYRTKVLLEGIFPIHPAGSWKACIQSRGSMDGMWAERRRQEAAKLYYRVLASICRAESQRLNTKNLSSVLMNEKFHRCMLTCAAELVIATHKSVHMTFPAVLEPTGITAFDLTKVIESFVRYEDTLPRELKRHLNNLEERLLESMAWEKGSAMYNTLIVARPRLAQEISRMGLLAEPMPSLDTLIPSHSRRDEKREGITDAIPASPEREASLPSAEQANHAPAKVPCFASPARERPSAFSAFNAGRRGVSNLQSVFASPHRPNPHAGGETCAETTITMFLQKVLKLAAIRIKALCERLQLQQPNYVIENVYRVVQHAVQNVTSIFFNRHLDIMVLCAIYGVCKVMKLNLTFKGIIYTYRKFPQSKAHVYRAVFMDRRGGRGSETGDIIKFYNDIFVPATKNVLVTIAPPPPLAATGGDAAAEDNPAPGSPRPSAFPTLPDMSPKKVSAQHNVFVSPLRNAKAENIMSPHSRSLYACLGESTHAYQSPSRDLTAINNRLNNRRMGRLDFEEPSVISDSDAAGAFFPSNPPRPSTSESAPLPPPPPQSPAKKRAKLDR